MIMGKNQGKIEDRIYYYCNDVVHFMKAFSKKSAINLCPKFDKCIPSPNKNISFDEIPFSSRNGIGSKQVNTFLFNSKLINCCSLILGRFNCRI